MSLFNRFTASVPKKHLLNTNTWRTTFMVLFIVFVSVSLTIWFLWRSLYLPELRNHARYLASELRLIDSLQTQWDKQHTPSTSKLSIIKNLHLVLVESEIDFPDVEKKIVAGFFTKILQDEINAQLGRDVVVFFKFKPTPQLWLQDSKHHDYWVREPVIYYAQYSPTLMVLFVLGIPILTLVTIALLSRQLNRPLRNLQRAALNYIDAGQVSRLPTESGPVEIRQVNTAFNHLFTTLTQTQKERTIMLAGISHDLRTPLTRMRLTAEMLPDEFLREGLIYDIEDMDAILEQFISFMKDGSDEPLQLTNLDAIFQEIIVQFAPLKFKYQPHHHLSETTQEWIEDLPLVALRPLSIKRMIVNLVNNASRYGKPPIHLSATIVAINPKTKNPDIHNNPDIHIDSSILPDLANVKLDEAQADSKSDVNYKSTNDAVVVNSHKRAKEELVICVRDCGEGVDEQNLARIMQPFERGEAARTKQGSGLGLAIVNRIARLHYGYVEATNHPDGGLQVSIHIPVLNNTPSMKV